MQTGLEEEKAEPDSNSNQYLDVLDGSLRNEGNGVLTPKMKVFIELKEKYWIF